MSIILANAGHPVINTKVFTQGERFVVRLFTALNGDATPERVLGDFTECTFPGYAAVPLAAGQWSVGSSASAVAGFECSESEGGEEVIGYLLSGETSGLLVFFALFDTPYLLDDPGDRLDVAVTLTPVAVL